MAAAARPAGAGPAPTLDRPPIERYVRCSVTRGSWTVEPGIEWRTGDDFAAVSGLLERIAEDIALSALGGDPVEAAMRAEPTFEAWWPGRAFFVEVHDAAGRWVQTYQPFGIPRNR